MRAKLVGTDGFVRFLRVLRLAGVDARRAGHIALAIALADDLARIGDAFGRHLHAIGTHIGDETDRLAADIDAFIKLLRDLHGALGREAELARGFLLQGRGDEGRRRVALDRLALDAADREHCCALIASTARVASASLLERKLVELLAVQMREMRAERAFRRASNPHRCVQYSCGLERLDLDLALADQPQRHRLHAPRRSRARQFAPQHGRQREADKIIERAARQIGVDQFFVDLRADARWLRAPRFLVTALNTTRSTGILPSAFFCLSTSSTCQEIASPSRSGSVARISLSAPFSASAMSLIRFCGAGIDFPGHGEVVVRLHRAVLGRQVADMAEAGQHLIAGAQILVDGLGLGRGFRRRERSYGELDTF